MEITHISTKRSASIMSSLPTTPDRSVMLSFAFVYEEKSKQVWWLWVNQETLSFSSKIIITAEQDACNFVFFLSHDSWVYISSWHLPSFKTKRQHSDYSLDHLFLFLFLIKQQKNAYKNLDLPEWTPLIGWVHPAKHTQFIRWQYCQDVLSMLWNWDVSGSLIITTKLYGMRKRSFDLQRTYMNLCGLQMPVWNLRHRNVGISWSGNLVVIQNGIVFANNLMLMNN